MARSILTLLMALLLFCLPWRTDSAEAVPSYHVKAAFIYNFIKFIEWPTTAFKDSRTPYIVGVLGKDPFGSDLKNTMSDKTINGRPILVRSVTDPEIGKCHALFISSSERRRLKSILDQAKGAPVLTIGETEEFAQMGGIINFVIEDNKVRFQINIEAAKRADLKIHSTLLNLAKVIRERAS